MRKDINQLLTQYNPLILNTYKRLHPMLNNRHDKEDLLSEIKLLFIQLVQEYDERRKVDFPLYIKRMLNFRTYHFVTKTYKVHNRESIMEGLTNDEHTYEKDVEHAIPEDFDKIVNALSWDGKLHMGKKQEKVFIGLLQGKSVKDLAEEEGVGIGVIHSRLHSIIHKLEDKNEYRKQLEEKYGL